jgi:ribosomal 50S subunit-recycling heat shock protein
MRIDQFIQKTGIVKRRSLAKELCDRGAVQLDGRLAKAAHLVAAGNVLTVRFHDRRCDYKVLGLPLGNVRKESRTEYVQLTSEQLFHEE